MNNIIESKHTDSTNLGLIAMAIESRNFSNSNININNNINSNINNNNDNNNNNNNNNNINNNNNQKSIQTMKVNVKSLKNVTIVFRTDPMNNNQPNVRSILQNSNQIFEL